MSSFFQALSTYESKHRDPATSFAQLMRSVIERETTGEEANQVRCVCASVANALEDQLASNARYFGEQYERIDWWRRTGSSTDALGICPSEQVTGRVLTDREAAEHRATLMTCARNADSFLADSDGRARIESILAHYRKELGQPLESWKQRMEAVVAGALDYDDAIDLIDGCTSVAIGIEEGANQCAGAGGPEVAHTPWGEIANTAFEVLCGNPDDAEARRVLLVCGEVADGTPNYLDDMRAILIGKGKIDGELAVR